VELVVSDDHEGLKAAVAPIFREPVGKDARSITPGTCLGGGHARRKELAEDPRGVFAAPSREVALGLASELADRWRGSHPGVAKNLEELLEECLPGVSPQAHPHHKRPRTSQSEEIKRRSRVVRSSPIARRA
jgi:putative transposase